MSEQSTDKETILGTTLRVLVRKIGLTPEEVAQLRLSDLHLVGKSPNLSFTAEESEEPKTVTLDMEAHRALVGWLVARPDSVGDFLFPGRGVEAMAVLEIQDLVEQAEEAALAAEPPTSAEVPDVGEEVSPGKEASPPSVGETTRVSGSRPVPPPSAPEMGAPPPGLDATMVSSFPPPTMPPSTAPEEDVPGHVPLPTAAPKPPTTAPEEEESVDISLPTSAPKPSPFHPLEPVPIPMDQGEDLEKSGSPDAVAPSSDPGKEEMGEVDSFSEHVEPKARVAAPFTRKRGKPTAREAAQRSSTLSRLAAIPVVGIAIILLCVLCLGGSGWVAWQSATGQEILAGLGLAEGTDSFEAIQGTPNVIGVQPPDDLSLPTPTLPPTMTPTTTEIPTETVTPIPTETPVPTGTPVPTDTPVLPTDTLVPTDTPIPPTDTPIPIVPEETPTPEDTPTPAMKYERPVLLEPRDRFRFIGGNTIVLRWQPVGELAPDEQYAVRLVYRFNGETTFQGANIKETEWTVPLSLYKQIDPPENLYEWFVVVERLNDDGSGTSISPESERRSFTWK